MKTKKHKNKKRIIITKRDKALFLYLFQNKIANFEQIRRDIFDSTAMQTVYVRLGKLRQADFIKRFPYRNKMAVSSYFQITKKCHAEHLKGVLAVQYDRRKVDVIEHDLRLNDIRRFFLQKKRVQHYFTSNELFARFDLKGNSIISKYASVGVDAVVGVIGGDGKVCHLGLEYEHTLKPKTRCKKQVRNYYFRPNLGSILFIYKTNDIYKRFMEIDKQFSEGSCRPKLFFLSLEEILSEKREVAFENLNKDRIIIK